jgi:lipoate-protein ligase A
MAIDAALLAAVRLGAPPVLRLYRWAPACLSFGRNQTARGIYAIERVRACGMDVVRRPTGGFAVLHDHELTYAVIAGVESFGGLRRAYVVINEMLVAGLRRLGVGADIVRNGAVPSLPMRSVRAPCFETAAPGEVSAGGRKLVGSAQRREGATLLQHGSLLLDGDQGAIRGLLSAPQPESRASHATLREVLGTAPGWSAVADAVADGFRDCGIGLAPATLSRDERASARALRARFEDDAWTWRR